MHLFTSPAAVTAAVTAAPTGNSRGTGPKNYRTGRNQHNVGRVLSSVG